MGVYRKKHHTERDRTPIQSRSIIRPVFAAPDWLSAMAVFVFIVARLLIFVKPFSVSLTAALEGFDYSHQDVSVSTRNPFRYIRQLENWIPLVIRLSGLWNGNIPAHPSHTRKQPVWAIRSTSMLFSFQIGDKIRFWAIPMHDGESVGMTEGCNESKPDAQGGDEMIHPVGFASTRTISFW